MSGFRDEVRVEPGGQSLSPAGGPGQYIPEDQSYRLAVHLGGDEFKPGRSVVPAGHGIEAVARSFMSYLTRLAGLWFRPACSPLTSSYGACRKNAAHRDRRGEAERQRPESHDSR